MNMSGQVNATASLEARVIHHEFWCASLFSEGDCNCAPVMDDVIDLGDSPIVVATKVSFWVIALLLLLAGVVVVLVKYWALLLIFGVVTNAGVNYMAADFLTGSGAHIDAFQYHDCGTGTTAESVTQTALVTPAGSARVAGTGSNPSANIYKSIATITPGSVLAITEWGLFSATSVGTMWDRRVFSAINVGATDSIQFTYQLTLTSGG